VLDITRLDESGNRRTGFFSEVEVRLVMLSLDSDLADPTLFAWLTGMRKSEIASLRWEDVTGDEICLRAETAKTGEGRTIPFEGELAELIERRKKARQFKVKNVVNLSALIFHRRGAPIQRLNSGAGDGAEVSRSGRGATQRRRLALAAAAT
jgi:integrase